MITRIKIDGFKAFKNFEIELGAFSMIAGTNGAGKSNLFDVLHLLRRLTEVDLKTAFSEQRGDAKELFTLENSTENISTYATKMSFEIDFLVDKKIKDSWGGEKELKYTRLNYKLIIKRAKNKRGIERLFVEEESLKTIKNAEDTWITKNIPKKYIKNWRPLIKGGRKQPYISISNKNGLPTILLHQDGERGGKPVPAQEIERTVLSSVNNISFPHAYAVKKEMKNWQFLHLSPTKLREPSKRLANDVITEDGTNLAAALYRIKQNNVRSLKHISRELSNLLPSFSAIEVEEDLQRNLYVLKVVSTDGREFSSRVLSEGTLRMIVLCVFKHDEHHQGLLCFEEPENGVHPFRLRAILRLLGGLSTSFDDENDQNLPLRQLITNTHSPVLVSEVVKMKGNVKLLYAKLISHINPTTRSSQRITSIVPVVVDAIKKQLKLDFEPFDHLQPQDTITSSEVIKYLQTVDIEQL